jgi:hypothetical protein
MKTVDSESLYECLFLPKTMMNSDWYAKKKKDECKQNALLKRSCSGGRPHLQQRGRPLRRARSYLEKEVSICSAGTRLHHRKHAYQK